MLQINKDEEREVIIVGWEGSRTARIANHGAKVIIPVPILIFRFTTCRQSRIVNKLETVMSDIPRAW